MKPTHFREVDPAKNCNECKKHKLVMPAGKGEVPRMFCFKHNFDLPGCSTRVLSNFVCDDFERFADES